MSQRRFIFTTAIAVLCATAVSTEFLSGRHTAGATPLEQLQPNSTVLKISHTFPVFQKERALERVLASHQSQSQVPRLTGSMPLFYATWLREGNPKTAYSYTFDTRGQVRFQRVIYNYATQGGGMLTTDKQEQQEMLALLPTLPPGLSEPPSHKHLLIVSTSVGGKWKTSVYDRAHLPDEVRQAITQVRRLGGAIDGGPDPELPPHNLVRTTPPRYARQGHAGQSAATP